MPERGAGNLEVKTLGAADERLGSSLLAKPGKSAWKTACASGQGRRRQVVHRGTGAELLAAKLPSPKRGKATGRRLAGSRTVPAWLLPYLAAERRAT